MSCGLFFVGTTYYVFASENTVQVLNTIVFRENCTLCNAHTPTLMKYVYDGCAHCTAYTHLYI